MGEYERVVTRIILPEGADNVRFQTSVPLVSNTTSLHRTFMDTLGRTTLTLTALNVVDEFRDRDLLVTYDLPFSARFTKPNHFGGDAGRLCAELGRRQLGCKHWREEEDGL